MALIAASWLDMPFSFVGGALTTTMASSTTIRSPARSQTGVEMLTVKPSARHRGKRADNGHRTVSPAPASTPVLQKNKDHHQDQQAGLDQRLCDFLDRFGRRIWWCRTALYLDVCRKLFLRVRPSSSAPAASTSSALAPGDWNTPMPVAGLLLSENILAVGLGAEFDRADVAAG